MSSLYIQARQVLKSRAEATDYRGRLHLAAATVLGIDLDELEKAFADGQSIRQIAEARGVDLTEIRASLKEVHQAQIQQAIDNGELSQEQAELIQSQNNLAPWLSDDHYLSCIMIGF